MQNAGKPLKTTIFSLHVNTIAVERNQKDQALFSKSKGLPPRGTQHQTANELEHNLAREADEHEGCAQPNWKDCHFTLSTVVRMIYESRELTAALPSSERSARGQVEEPNEVPKYWTYKTYQAANSERMKPNRSKRSLSQHGWRYTRDAFHAYGLASRPLSVSLQRLSVTLEFVHIDP